MEGEEREEKEKRKRREREEKEKRKRREKEEKKKSVNLPQFCGVIHFDNFIFAPCRNDWISNSNATN